MMCWQGAWALPDIPSFSLCPDLIHHSGFQNNSSPSNGSGGTFPYEGLDTVQVGQSQFSYYLHVPLSYDGSVAYPILALLQPQTAPGQNQQGAEAMHDFWLATASEYHFITVTNITTGSQGGWIPSQDSQILAAIFQQVEAEYNIEQNRRYLHGFSAGAHVGLAIGLQNADYFAAQAFNAGALSQFAGSSAPSNAVRHIATLQAVGFSDPLHPHVLNDQQTFTNAGWISGQDHQLLEFNGGHQLPNDADEVAAEFLCLRSLLD